MMLRLNSSIVLISFYYLFWLLSNDNLCVLPEKFTLQLEGWLVMVLRLKVVIQHYLQQIRSLHDSIIK